MLSGLFPYEGMIGAERGLLLNIGIQLINACVEFDCNRYLSVGRLLEVNKNVLCLSSKFEKYFEWKEISPKILKLSVDLYNYSSREELMTSIAEIFAGKYFRLKRARV